MSIFKTILKLFGAFLIGGAFGLVIAMIIICVFTDTSISEFLNKLVSANLSDTAGAFLVGVLSLLVSIPLITIIHEGGHLIFGRLSGYKFVSFRIFNYTFIKKDGKIAIKPFSVAGTGGQCLLSPPDAEEAKIPVVWYNLGGVIANLVSILIILPIFRMNINPFVKEFGLIFILASAIMIVLNGIPLRISGICNDGMNAIQLRKNKEGKHGMLIQLRANALIQEGIRPKDMPGEFFLMQESIDYKDTLQVSIPVMAASRLLDEGRIADARKSFEELYRHSADIMPLYVKEIACELTYIYLVEGEIDKAKELYTKDLQKYVKAYSKVMSSKERLLCAVALRMDNNPEKARGIYETLVSRRDHYLLQGEVKSDIALMKELLQSQEKAL